MLTNGNACLLLHAETDGKLRMRNSEVQFSQEASGSSDRKGRGKFQTKLPEVSPEELRITKNRFL